MAPRIVIIGGGSYQWVPKLLCDVARTKSLQTAEIVLEDIASEPLAEMGDFARELAARSGAMWTVATTTDQCEALAGADFVVVTISTGGFGSMRFDLEIPAKYGIKQSVGDTVGPGGIMRALRNIPVLLSIARDMQELCPDAWLLNITNPMTVLCRAVTRESPIKTIGLCHEVTLTQFTLSQLLDADFREFDFTVAGVNHLPLITDMRIAGQDGFARLREVLERDDPRTQGIVASNRLKLALYERFGVLPAAGDRHLAEFFPGFLTEESDWGERWGVQLTTIQDREQWLDYYRQEFANLRAAPGLPELPSGELVAPLIDALLRDKRRELPVNLPNEGQCPDLPPESVVEAMCTADGGGIRGRDSAPVPPVLAEWLRRIVASQEMTVAAALSGDRADVVDAMLLDPLAGRIDYDSLGRMSGEMISATKKWLPQFV